MIVLLDQIIKVYIKTTYNIGGGFNILGQEWAQIHFVENKGMAFGLSYGGVVGKYALSIFRIVMVAFLIYFLSTIIKSKGKLGLQISFAFIVAGAIGNIVDGAFYGLIFSESCYHHCDVAHFVPFGTGYASFLQGSVVDMFYFPMIDTHWPEWFPLVGGDRFAFFKPVFNLADAAISVGVFLIFVFYRSYFLGKPKKETPKAEPIIISTDQSTDSIGSEIQ